MIASSLFRFDAAVLRRSCGVQWRILLWRMIADCAVLTVVSGRPALIGLASTHSPAPVTRTPKPRTWSSQR